MSPTILDRLRTLAEDVWFRSSHKHRDVKEYKLSYAGGARSLKTWRSWHKKHIAFLPIWKIDAIQKNAANVYEVFVLRLKDKSNTIHPIYKEVGILDDQEERYPLYQLAFAMVAYCKGYLDAQGFTYAISREVMNPVVLALPWENSKGFKILGQALKHGGVQEDVWNSMEPLYTAYRQTLIQTKHSAMYVFDDPLAYLCSVRGGILPDRPIEALDVDDDILSAVDKTIGMRS